MTILLIIPRGHGPPHEHLSTVKQSLAVPPIMGMTIFGVFGVFGKKEAEMMNWL
jgi:hypothetical protein